ncbi:MAG: nuclear transport factor 2 family protein [Thermoleophilaceae bacterium]
MGADRLAALEARLARLESIEEIKALKVRYAHACDAPYDAEAIAALFTEDGVWDGGKFGRYDGREEIRDHFLTSPTRFAWQATCVMCSRIEPSADGETADGQWYLWEPCTLKVGGADVAAWQFGRYDDRYRRVDGEWLFSEVAFTMEMLAPFQTGWADEMVMTTRPGS